MFNNAGTCASRPLPFIPSAMLKAISICVSLNCFGRVASLQQYGIEAVFFQYFIDRINGFYAVIIRLQRLQF